jgi:AcrR family transcriptional regulator
MLDAAELMLVRHGPEGATLPRIARQARLSPASVYRRFRDKDALMRAVFRRFNEQSQGAVASGFEPEAIRPIGLRPFARTVIAGMVTGFRASAALSRAAIEYAERHPHVDFIRKSAESEARSFQRIVDAFLAWRDEIRHPDPEFAIRLGFVVVACALRDLVLFDRMGTMSRVLPLDDQVLQRELPRLFLRCLGVDDEPTTRPVGRRA